MQSSIFLCKSQWSLVMPLIMTVMTRQNTSLHLKGKHCLQTFEGKSEVDAGPSGRRECGGKGSDLKALPQDHRGSTWIHSLVGRLCHSDSESDSDLERFDTWMKLYLASLPTVDHEYLKHHLGCIFAVSTTTKYAS